MKTLLFTQDTFVVVNPAQPKIVVSGQATARPAAMVTAAAQGLPGESPEYKLFVQDTESAEWVVQHDFGRYPAAVMTVDQTGDAIYGVVKNVSVNEVHISFNPAQSGTAVVI